MVKPVLKTLLLLILLLALAVLSWLLVLFLAWPLWGAFAIFFAVLGVYFGLKALRRFWIISRVKTKLMASERRLRLSDQQKPDYQEVLLKKWRSAVESLRNSRLQLKGNPLYVLPWYLVMGESGSGKTTAITRSRLTPMMRESAQKNQIVQTQNFDWWFFSEAIVLDSAGRYVSPDGVPQDQQEWEYLLELFARYRSREGLNGLVVVIDAPVLLAMDKPRIEQRGQSLRDRIDQLMRLFEKRLPVYVMVTKCDQIYGFSQWANQLTPAQSQQAMGFLADGSLRINDEQRFAQEAMQTIASRLEKIRLDSAIRGLALSPELLLLPGELLRLVPGLQLFLQSALGHNPYLEHPQLRGLFLTSARQDPPQPSRLAALLPAPADQNDLQGAGEGFFIHDIFSRILPQERYAALPGRIVSRWRRASANLALVAWLMLCTAAFIFLVVSHQSTSATIARLGRAIPPGYGSPVQTDFQSEMDTLSSGMVLVEMILAEEKKWQTRWLAFNPEVEWLEASLKQEFVTRFRRIYSSEQGVNLDLKPLLKSSDVTVRAYAVQALARHINMIQARIDGAEYDAIMAMPQMPPQLLPILEPRLDRKLLVGIDSLMSAAIAWSSPKDPWLKTTLKRSREMLREQVLGSGQFHWLLDWANALPDLSPVTLNEFWLTNPGRSVQEEVSRGLTLEGRARIAGLLAELKQALPEEAGLVRIATGFDTWYLEQRLFEWHSFAWGFMEGEKLLTSEPFYRDAVISLDKANSPFELFLKRLLDEFHDLPADQSPSWLQFARYHASLHDHVKKRTVMKPAADLLSAIQQSAGPAMRDSIDQKTNLVPGAIGRTRQDMVLLERYLEASKASLQPALTGPTQALSMAVGFLGGGEAQETAAPSALAQMHSALQEMRANSQYKAHADEAIWRLIEGPRQLIGRYAMEQASCKLQEEWDKGVIWKTRMAVSPQEASSQLFDGQGAVWAFLDGPAKGLVTRPSGIFAQAEREDLQFPFAPGFVDFLNQAVSMRVDEVVRQKRAESSAGKSASLTLMAQPIGVNAGARVRPYAANLTLQCSKETVELSNMNMQASKTFVWSPDQCGEVNLQIKLDRMTLNRRYPGALGLANFLGEFRDGARIFTPADFPAASARLEVLGVREITLRYDMTGLDQVLSLARDHAFLMEQSAPSSLPAISRLQIQVPARAGRCWTVNASEMETLTVPMLIRQEAEQRIQSSSGKKKDVRTNKKAD